MTEVRRRRRRGGSDGDPVVPEATFTSYYGRPIVKASPWEADIPAYLFFGGVAAGSSLLAAGADLTDRPGLRRTGRLGALVAISLSFGALVHDLGRPARFVNMLRVVKLTSPMSVGTWLLTLYGPAAGLAAAAEVERLLPLPGPVRRLVRALGRPAGLGAAVIAPTIASYTAALLVDTATPAWHDAHRELPFVFVGSAAAAAGGLGMLGASVSEAGPARRLAVLGAVGELVAEHRMESSMGLSAETLHTGVPRRLLQASRALTVIGALGAALVGRRSWMVGRRNRGLGRRSRALSGHRAIERRSRTLSAVAGVALMAGSACTRFAVFTAGQASAQDPKYTVVPQRERLEQA